MCVRNAEEKSHMPYSEGTVAVDTTVLVQASSPRGRIHVT